jgi:hypothetical protein
MATITFEYWAKPNKIATMITDRYSQFQMYRTTNRDKWTELESYLYATDTTSLDGGSAHDHTTHIPILASLKEELEAIVYSAVMPHEEFLGWRPYDREANSIAVRRKVLEYVRNRHVLNDFERTLRKLIQDLVMYGICFSKVCYVDERVNGVGYVGPKPVRISPYDIVFDPTRTDFKSTPKILRQLLSVGEFIDMAQSIPHEIDQSVVERVIDRRGSYTSLSKTELNKAKQYTPDGFTNMEAYYMSSMVEVLWFYGDVFDSDTKQYRKNRCAVVVDRVDLLVEYEEPNPRIFKGSWAEKPDNLWSQGPLDKVVGLNYQINHRENSKSDALDRYIHPDKVFMGDVEEVYNESTGQTIYLAPEGGGVRDLVPDTTVLTADLHQDRLMQHARTAAGLPPQLMGFRTPGEKTLGEVQNLDDAALRKFLHKAEQLELDLLEPMVKAEIDIGRENFHSVIEAISTDEEGMPILLSITKADLSANGKLVPMGARRFKRQNQQMTMLNLLANSNLGNLTAAHLKTFNLAQAVEELGGFAQFELYEKHGAMIEQADAEVTMAALQQQTVNTVSQPSAVEVVG